MSGFFHQCSLNLGVSMRIDLRRFSRPKRRHCRGHHLQRHTVVAARTPSCSRTRQGCHPAGTEWTLVLEVQLPTRTASLGGLVWSKCWIFGCCRVPWSSHWWFLSSRALSGGWPRPTVSLLQYKQQLSLSSVYLQKCCLCLLCMRITYYFRFLFLETKTTEAET